MTEEEMREAFERRGMDPDFYARLSFALEGVPMEQIATVALSIAVTAAFKAQIPMLDFQRRIVEMFADRQQYGDDPPDPPDVIAKRRRSQRTGMKRPRTVRSQQSGFPKKF